MPKTTTILFVPPSPGPAPVGATPFRPPSPGLRHPSNRGEGNAGQPGKSKLTVARYARDQGVTTAVPICTRRTTKKTNTITITSKRLPPLPTTDVKVDLAGEWRLSSEMQNQHIEQRRSMDDCIRKEKEPLHRIIRLPSMDLGEILQLDQLEGMATMKGPSNETVCYDANKNEPNQRGRERNRREAVESEREVVDIGPERRVKRELKVSLPSVMGLGSRISGGGNEVGGEQFGLREFQIHAEDVIPKKTEKTERVSETPLRTLYLPELNFGEDRIEIKIEEKIEDCKEMKGNNSTNLGADDHLVERVLSRANAHNIQLQESLRNAHELTQFTNAQSLTKSPADQQQKPGTFGARTRASWELHSRLLVKRKPVPPLRVHSLPVIRVERAENHDEIIGSGCNSSPALHSDNHGYQQPEVPIIPPYTCAELPTEFNRRHSSDSERVGGSVNRHTRIGLLVPCTHTPQRSSSTPPTPRTAPLEAVRSAPIRDWRTLSSLDLTSTDELALYLDSLIIIAGPPSEDQFLRLNSYRVSASGSSYYGNDTPSFLPPSPFGSYPSNVPSPSAYIPYRKGPFSPAPPSVPGTIELPASPQSPNEIRRRGPMVNVGQLRIPKATGSADFQPLDVILTAPMRGGTNERDMPCRTTVLKNTRRVTFVPPGTIRGADPLMGPKDPAKSGLVEADSSTSNLLESRGALKSSIPASVMPRSPLSIGNGKGLLNRESSKRIRTRGGTILRRRGRDVYLELVVLGDLPLGNCSTPVGYGAFINRIDGSVWFVANGTNVHVTGVFDAWIMSILPRARWPSGREKVVAVRWADGLDCVDALRGAGVAMGATTGPAPTRQGRMGGGELEVECALTAVELEGVEVYLGERVEEEEDGWFEPEGW
ncbi:hypothetical protein BDZ91DRAFT_761128 [Kalaharituber pfeilii]|nr:hypothetical protein BDZ91DRAFT_761128 [Kalaharituber pfeilii]